MNELIKHLKDNGASIVGFSHLKNILPENLKDLEYGISIGVRLSDAIIDQIENEPTFTYFHHYRTVNTLIDQITLKAMLFIMNTGFKSFAIPASQTVHDSDKKHYGTFPHKTAANLAGLGWIGKSALFISNDFGPRIRLGTILTDMPLPFSKPDLASKCGECSECVKNCPAKAISGLNWQEGFEREKIFDAKACADFMFKEFKNIGRGSVCGICIKACPKKLKTTFTEQSRSECGFS
jgi:epoxyqueuosine reductase